MLRKRYNVNFCNTFAIQPFVNEECYRLRRVYSVRASTDAGEIGKSGNIRIRIFVSD